MSNFTEISKKYEKDSIVQKSASKTLFELHDIQPKDNVLDLGCGTGHMLKLIREKTEGKVVGVDPSEGMIKKAKEKLSNQNISFRICSAEQLDYQNEFEVIYSNSALQWFSSPAQALKACYRSLKNNGKMAIQAPAKDNFCPNFLQAIHEVKRHKALKDTFACFNPSWFFRNSAREYTELFESVGFKVEKSTIDEVVTRHTADEAYNIFESGAAAGYLNPHYYSTKLSQKYIMTFRDIVRRSLQDQGDESGRVRLTFFRIYLLALKNELRG